MRGVLLVIAACAPAALPARVPAPKPSRPTLASWRTLVTPLQVIVIDDYRTRTSCDGVAPRSIDVIVDGRPAGTIAIPCSTQVRAPPPQHSAPVFQVPPGKHVIQLRERATGLATEAELEFPLIEPPFGDAEDDTVHVLATKLPVWANEDELEIQGLRASMNSL
jgi:hypothetical protein